MRGKIKLKNVNKQKKLIAVIGLSVVVLFAALLLFKNQIFADVISDSECTTDHPYTVKTGKQIYYYKPTIEYETGFPGLPQNHLMRILRDDVRTELGNFADNKTIVCYQKGDSIVQIPSFIESGEVWFQIQDDIAPNSEAKYYISKISDESKRKDLVSASDIETHPFKTESAFSSPVPTAEKTYWTWKVNTILNADIKVTEDTSPGGNDTVKVSNFSGKSPDGKSPLTLEKKSVTYDPSVDETKKDTYTISLGWVKFSNIKVPRENGLSKQEYYYAGIRDFYTNWSDPLYITDDVNSDWERFYSPTILRREKLDRFIYAYVRNMNSGEIYYSSFKFINNIKAPRELKKNVPIGSNPSAEITWKENYVSYFGTAEINPRSVTNYQDSPFIADPSTKLYLTNNSADYYKEHYDGPNLVLTSKLNKALQEKQKLTVATSEIKDFKAQKSIIIGDLDNQEFKDFALKIRPDIASLSFRKEGFRIFVSEKYILAVGKDMVGSYYASLRLADLFASNFEISPRMEEDYPDNSGFRSYYSPNYTQSEHNMAVLKADIKRSSELRYNIFPVNGPQEYESMDVTHDYKDANGNPANSARIEKLELFSYARKYFIEPVASSFGMGWARTGLEQNLLYQEDVPISIYGRSAQFTKNLTRKFTDEERAGNDPSEIPLIVKDSTGTKTLTEGVDYEITDNRIQPNLWDLTVVLQDGTEKNIRFGKHPDHEWGSSEYLTSEPIELWNKDKTVKYDKKLTKAESILNGGYWAEKSGDKWGVHIPINPKSDSMILPTMWNLKVVLKDNTEKNLVFGKNPDPKVLNLASSEQLTSEPIELWNDSKSVKYELKDNGSNEQYYVDSLKDNRWQINIPMSYQSEYKKGIIKILDTSTIQPTLWDLTVVLKDKTEKNIRFGKQPDQNWGTVDVGQEPIELWDKNKKIPYVKRSQADAIAKGGYFISGSGTKWGIHVPMNSDALRTGYQVKITFNGMSTERNGDFNKASRTTSKSAREFAARGIENAIKYLKPKYIHINNDEYPGIGMDYRNIYNPDGTKTGATSADLYADLINFEYNKIKSLSPSTEVIMWADMLNPYHIGGWNYGLNKAPYTFAAIDKIPKDIILDNWFGTPGDSINCQQTQNSTKYLMNKGFRVIVGQTFAKCPEKLQDKYPTQFLGSYIPEWTYEKDDKISSPIKAMQLWSSAKSSLAQGGTSPTWQDGSFIVPSPTPIPSPSKTAIIVPSPSPSPSKTSIPTSSISSPPNPSIPTTSYTFPKGFSTLGVTKSLSTSLITTVDGLYVYQFDGINNKWLMAPTDSFTLEPSKGYYVYNKQDTKTISLPYDTFAANSYALTKGWNMLHSLSTKQKSDIKLSHNNTPSTIDSLISQNIINPRVFIIDNEKSTDPCSYFSILDNTDELPNCSTSSPKKTKSIPSGKAFWVYVK